MLTIVVKDQDLFDEDKQVFVPVKGVVLDLEHSLVSVSKWESIHRIPFLTSTSELSGELLFDYLKCMVVTPDVDPAVLAYADSADLSRIQDYIVSTESATTFSQQPGTTSNQERITSELIYYWMDAYRIPQEAETWHLSRLFSRIRIHSVKNSKPQKRSPQEIAAERRALNEARRKQFNSRG